MKGLISRLAVWSLVGLMGLLLLKVLFLLSHGPLGWVIFFVGWYLGTLAILALGLRLLFLIHSRDLKGDVVLDTALMVLSYCLWQFVGLFGRMV
jgi:hypothetical protein